MRPFKINGPKAADWTLGIGLVLSFLILIAAFGDGGYWLISVFWDGPKALGHGAILMVGGIFAFGLSVMITLIIARLFDPKLFESGR